MIHGLVALLSGQLIGEIIVRALALPAPGPVVGLAFFVVFLGLFKRLSWSTRAIDETADGILRHLALLFVPASVGIVGHLDLLSGRVFGLTLAVFVSTLATLIVTVLVFLIFDRLTKGGKRDEASEGADQ